MDEKNLKNLSKKPSVVFFGTPHFAVYVLEEMTQAGIPPSLLVTAPEKPAGRGLLPRPSPVKEWGLKQGIPVAEPAKLEVSDAGAAILFQQSFDLFVVAGYGKILPHSLLSRTKHGVLNVHPSLLPKYRGPSPIETQILQNDQNPGVSIILLDEETDHGPVLAQETPALPRWPLSRSELEDTLWKRGGALIAECIPRYIAGELTPREQNHQEATFTKKLEKEDGLVDLSGDAYGNYLKFLAYERWPGTFFFTEKNEKKMRVKITGAEFENDTFVITRVIPEGKKEMSYADFIRNR
ncbi:methionyl-tRNA formyltransferase [Patescibacteria group bacterium]|nr:methionyl-tRNA formyltransferase [Patescibacteria group bacterium]